MFSSRTCRCLIFWAVLTSLALPWSVAGAQEHHAADHDHTADHGAADHGHEGGDGHHEEYTIWADLPFWSLIAFIGFVASIKVLGLWGALTNGMSRRENAEKEAIALAESALSSGQAVLRQARGRLEAMDETVRETLAEAERDAASTREEILGAARTEAQLSVGRARHEIERVRDQSLSQLFESLAEKVADVTEQRLRTGLNTDDHHRLVAKTLNELSVR